MHEGYTGTLLNAIFNLISWRKGPQKQKCPGLQRVTMWPWAELCRGPAHRSPGQDLEASLPPAASSQSPWPPVLPPPLPACSQCKLRQKYKPFVRAPVLLGSSPFICPSRPWKVAPDTFLVSFLITPVPNPHAPRPQ